MSIGAQTSAAGIAGSGPAVCHACGAPAAGTVACPACGAAASANFCAQCGADLRDGGGLLGTVSGGMRRSFPGTYLGILRAPVRATVALTDDPTYRNHVSFLLTSLAIFCVIMVPFFLQTADPTGAAAKYSESMQTLLKVLTQAGVYVGAVITVILGFVLFRLFAKQPRSFASYVKLYCLAFGFLMPPYAVYDYVARGYLGTTGLSSFAQNAPTPEQLLSTPFLVSLAVSLLMWAYMIAIHRRFWRMPIWKATGLYAATALISNQLGYYLMFHIGYWVTYWLVVWGIVVV